MTRLNYKKYKKRQKNRNIKRRKTGIKLSLFGALLLILAGGLIYAFFFSSLFKIREITIRGGDVFPVEEVLKVVNQELEGFSYHYFPKNSFYLVSSQRIYSILKNKFPKAKTIIVKKKFPASLFIALESREKAVIYCKQARSFQPQDSEDLTEDNEATTTDDVLEAILQPAEGESKCFFADSEGIIFEKAPEIYGGAMTVLKDASAREVEMGEAVINPEMVSFVNEVRNTLSEETNVRLLYFQINFYPSVDVVAWTTEGWQIIFDITRPAYPQVLMLKKVLQEKIKEQRDRLEYIDLRVENRVYYKLKK